MTTHTTPSAQAQQNAGHQHDDGRYAWVGAAAMAGAATATLVALWFYPVVVCAVWAAMLVLLGLMTARPTATPATA